MHMPPIDRFHNTPPLSDFITQQISLIQTEPTKEV